MKNITDFGAFVDLGGIDGLLHITDLSWGRVIAPERGRADRRRDRRQGAGLRAGARAHQPRPQAAPVLPVGERRGPSTRRAPSCAARWSSITNYGAFVELEKGVEGLIHISEMSWTRHIKHPSKVVNIGDEVNVMVLKIDKENEKISLGLKQCESDPWLTLAERYPVGTDHRGQGPQPDRFRRLRRGRGGHRRPGPHLAT